MPPQAPTQAQPTPTPAPIAPPITTPPPPLPPTPTPAIHEHAHPNVALIAIVCLLIGALAGAAAGYFAAQYEDMLLKPEVDTTDTPATVQQATNDQTSVDATASTYSDVDTNPLGDVQTNPF